MTISKADLLANEALALRLIGQHSIAAPIGDLHQKDAPQLQPILPTTWKSLEDAGYIRMLDIWHFQVLRRSRELTHPCFPKLTQAF